MLAALSARYININIKEYVMSIDEFGKLKGGFYLVKQLSQEGYALKPFRKIYADYLQTQYVKS